MKITIEYTEEDETKTEVLQDVFSYYVAVTQLNPVQVEGKGLVGHMLTKSFSRGSDVREMIKELKQSTVELERHLYGNNGS